MAGAGGSGPNRLRWDHPRPIQGSVTQTIAQSRAVVRTIDPGNTAVCAECGAPVKFVARAQLKQVIANVYVGGTWDRVEHYHEPCYGEAGAPHGPAV